MFEKNCSVCQLPFTTAKKYTYYCNPCGAKRAREWRVKNGDRARAASRKWHHAHPETAAACNRWGKLEKMYGVSRDEFNDMLRKQAGTCAICKTETPGGPGNRFQVDHDHQTGAVRGLLCSRCNFVLGYAKDRIKVLESAILYLKGASNVCEAL